MQTRVRFDFKAGMAIATGPETAQVLIGSYIGLPHEQESDIFDLYRMDGNGEPVGECQGQMGCTVSEAAPAED